MKIKRFKAPDMRQAIKMVREEHGADAVILSNRKVKDGIEIISAINYDESAVEKMLSPDKSNTAQVQSNHVASSLAKNTEGDVSDVSDFSVNTNELNEFKKNTQNYQDSELTSDLEDSSYNFSSEAQVKSSRYQVEQTNPAQVKQNEAVKKVTLKSEINREIKSHKRDLEVVAMQRELDTLKGILNTQIAQPSQLAIPHIHPSHNGIFARLQELGIRSDLCHEVLQQLPLSSEVNEGWRKALALLAHRISIVDEDILETGGIVALVGSTGVGKTTTLAKLAARFVLKHGRDKVALVSIDNYRIAAQDQIISYGQMIGVPVYLASGKAELKTILSDLYDKQLVLIDTAGVGQRDKRIGEQFSLLASMPYEISNYLVLSANTQESALSQIAKTYSQFDIAGCCLSKMDEAVSLGGLLSIIAKYEFSVGYISEGQRVPEDLQKARPYSLVSKAVTLMQQAEILSNSNTNSFGKNEEHYNAHAS